MAKFEMNVVHDGEKTVFIYEDDDEASPTVIALVETFKEAVRTKDFAPYYKLIEEVCREKWQNVNTSP